MYEICTVFKDCIYSNTIQYIVYIKKIFNNSVL